MNIGMTEFLLTCEQNNLLNNDIANRGLVKMCIFSFYIHHFRQLCCCFMQVFCASVFLTANEEIPLDELYTY